MEFPWVIGKVLLSVCLLMLSFCLCCLLQAGYQLVSALIWSVGPLIVASVLYWVLHSPFQELLPAEHIHRPAVYKGASSLPFKNSAYPEGNCQKPSVNSISALLVEMLFFLFDSKIISVSFLLYTWQVKTTPSSFGLKTLPGFYTFMSWSSSV